MNLGDIINCYAIGKVQGRMRIGGVLGVSSDNQATIQSCYFNSETVAQQIGNFGTAVTTDAMKTKSTYKGWDFEKVWDIDAKKNNGYPFLRKRGRVFYAEVALKSQASKSRVLNWDNIKSITASSVYKGKYNYNPENICDQDSTTAWVEGVVIQNDRYLLFPFRGHGGNFQIFDAIVCEIQLF